jgi:hypothetical protein
MIEKYAIQKYRNYNLKYRILNKKDNMLKFKKEQKQTSNKK